MKKVNSYREKGQDLVEYALIAPIFVLILFVITDIGRVAYIYSAVQNAAREGARAAIVEMDNATAVTRASQVARERVLGVDPLEVQVTAQVNQSTGVIVVRVSAPFYLITPLAGRLMGRTGPDDPLILSSQATMRLER